MVRHTWTPASLMSISKEFFQVRMTSLLASQGGPDQETVVRVTFESLLLFLEQGDVGGGCQLIWDYDVQYTYLEFILIIYMSNHHILLKELECYRVW